MGLAESPALVFQNLLRGVLARQVEYSFSNDADSVTTMSPVSDALVSRLSELARVLPFAAEWSWSVERFSSAVHPDAFLLRLDWLKNRPTAVTLYCRFPAEPTTADFHRALTCARPFRWHGPDPSSMAIALRVKGPRGIAFRATDQGSLRTALYFRSEQHAEGSRGGRLADLLAACQYPDGLVSRIEGDLRTLYRPGPAGVIGVDDGGDGVPRALKFDPSNVPLKTVFSFLASVGVSAARIGTLRSIAIGLRAEAVTYAGVQYGPTGFLGWRLYFACEPSSILSPAQMKITVQRNLRPARRLPHY
jgi:hypothetical protein